MDIVVSEKSFSWETVSALSRSLKEPDWMRNLRQHAWEVFEATPWPTKKDEDWKRTDLSGLKIEDFIPFVQGSSPVSTPEALPSNLRVSLSEMGEVGGLILQQNSTLLYKTLREEFRSQGVIFTDIPTALQEHPQLVRDYLQAGLQPEEGKFQAFLRAFQSGGSFLYVPKNRQILLPFHSLYWHQKPGVALFPYTLIVVEEGSEVTYIEEYGSADEAGPALCVGGVDIFVHPTSHVRYVSLQHLSEETWHFFNQHARIERNARIINLNVALGGKIGRSTIASHLTGIHADSEMYGCVFARDSQHFDYHTLQDHVASHTVSNLLYKMALQDQATTAYTGLIRVEKGTVGCDAYQANRNLILGTKAKATSDPKLEIEANDVRCTHGSTTGPVDEEQVFYMITRGLDRKTAEQMIVLGFFEEVLDKVPVEVAYEWVHRRIEERIQ